MSDTEIVHVPEKTRYEARVDGSLAGFAEYTVRDGVWHFDHTEVDDAYEGKGVGSTLAREALADVRERGVRIVPDCPFIKRWIDRHPDHADLVHSD